MLIIFDIDDSMVSPEQPDLETNQADVQRKKNKMFLYQLILKNKLKNNFLLFFLLCFLIFHSSCHKQTSLIKQRQRRLRPPLFGKILYLSSR